MKSSSRHVLAGLLGLGLLTVTSPRLAQADHSPDITFAGLYLPIGLNFGASLRSPGDHGLLFGGEVSLIRFWENPSRFRGWYLDYLYDRGSHSHRVSTGPEIGWQFFGVDAGVTVELDGHRTRMGLRPRLFSSFVFLTAYVGESIRVTDSNQRFATEVGVLLKVPWPQATCDKSACGALPFCDRGCAWGRW